MRYVVLLLWALGSCLEAANITYGFYIDRFAVPTNVNHPKLTLKVDVGTCASVTVTDDGSAVPVTYNAGTGLCTFEASGNTVVVTAINVTVPGTGVATKATLFADRKWAYSMVFDDSASEHYSIAKPLFDAYGWKASVALITSKIGAGSSYMTWANVLALRTSGWGILNHSLNHPTITAGNASAELISARDDIELHLPGYQVSCVVYPLGIATAGATVASLGFLSGLATESQWLDNYVDVFPTTPFNLKRNMVADTDVAALNAVFDAAHADVRPRWTIEGAHGIDPGSNPPTWPGGSTNEVTLNSHLNYLHTQYGAAGDNSVWVAPADEVMDYLYVRQNCVISTFTVGTATPTITGTPPTATNSATPSSSPTATPSFSVSPTPAPGPCAILVYDGEAPATNLAHGSLSVNPGTSVATEAAVAAHSGSQGLHAHFVWSASFAQFQWNWANYQLVNTYNASSAVNMEFWIRTAAGTFPSFNIVLRDMSGGSAVALSSYLPGGITTTWQKASIPLSAFSGINLAQLAEINIQTFSPPAGNVEFYFDDFGFSSGCASATATLTPAPASSTSTLTPTFTPTMTPTLTTTGTDTVVASATQSATAGPFISASPTMTSTHSATSLVGNTLTSTSTPSATAVSTIAPTFTATPSATASTTALMLTATSSATPGTTATSTLAPVVVATATAMPKAYRGRPAPMHVRALPNPQDGQTLGLAFEMSNAADAIQLKIYSSAYRLIATYTLPGAWAPGWNQTKVPLSDGGLSPGLYFAEIRGQLSTGESVRCPEIARILVLR